MSGIAETARLIGAHYLTALQHRDFRTLWTASLCAGAAHWALIVARGWLVFDLEGSSIWVGVVTFAAMFPRFFISPFAGLLADRFDRRTVLAGAFGLSMAHNVVLAGLALAGMIDVWYVVVLAVVDGSARAVMMPATGSLVPNLVPRERLLNAIALNAATIHGSRLLGPLLIAPLMGAVFEDTTGITGVTGAFLLCTVFYAIGMVQTLRVRTASTGVVRQDRSIIANLLEGLTYLYSHPLLRPLMILVVAHCALTMSFESILPVLSVEKLQAEGAAFSYLMMCVGAGAMIGVVVLGGLRSEATKGRVLLWLGIFSGLTPLALAVSPSLPVALLSAVAMGASQATFMALFASIIQTIIPDSIRGRATAIHNLHIGGIMAIFNLVNGGLADLVGAPILLIAPGLAFVGIVGLSFGSLALRRLYTEGSPASPQVVSALRAD